MTTHVGHLKASIVYIPQVNAIERDFDPMFALCLKIAEYLEYVQSLSWAQRKYFSKTELVEKAKAFTLRVDEVNCQVIIQLNEYHASSTAQSQNLRDIGIVNNSDAERGTYSHNSREIKFNNDVVIGALGMLVFVLIAFYIHFYTSSTVATLIK